MTIPLPTAVTAYAALHRELRLLYGVGPHHAEDLRSEGYPSLIELRKHPRWGDAASALLAEWGIPPNPRLVYRSLSTWLPSSHRRFLDLLAVLRMERLLFFDLETLGLSNAPIFLLATGRLTEGALHIRQTIASSLAAETSLLETMLEELETTDALLSYNGKSFDWNLIRERCAYYGLQRPDAPIHVDLLHTARRVYSALPDHHLGTVEREILGTGRTDDLPSALIPEIYIRFLKTQDTGLLEPILEHNRRDIESLALLLAALLKDTDDD